jgi:PAS domain S-box-containing protein
MRIWNIKKDFFSADDWSNDITHRFRVVRILKWVGGPFLYIYSASFFLNGFLMAAIMILMAGLTISIGSFWISRSQNLEKTLRLYQGMVGLFFFFMILHHFNLIGVNNRLDYLGWLFIYPLLAFISLGGRAGIILSLISFVAILFILLIQKPLMIPPGLILNLKVQTLIALTGTGLIAFICDNLRHQAAKELIEERRTLWDSENRLEESTLQLTREITERRQAEEALRQAHHELEKRVAERTEELRRAYEELRAENSERIKAEETLRESEERYRNVFQNHTAVKLLIDPDNGNIIEANEAAVNYYGWPYDRLKQMKIQEINALPPDDVNKEMKNVLSGKRIHFEFRHRRADGSIRDVEVFSSKIKIKGKDLLHSIIHDITDRKRVEEKLRESEEKYRLIAENMADVIALLDMNLRFTYISPSILRLRGFTVKEAMEQTIDQVLTLDSLKIARTVFEEEMRLEAGGHADPDRIRTMEVEEYRKDGSLTWVEVSLSFLRDEKQKALGILSVSRDISERKKAQDSTRKSEEYFRAITENISDIIIVVDALGTITYASPSIERFIGYRPDELVGKNSLDLILPDDHPRAIEDFGKALLTKEVAIPNSFHLRNKNGSERVLEGVGTNLIDNPVIAGFVMNIRDVTYRRRAEEERRNLEIKLQRAQKMEALGTMAGGVAHDLNNVLGIIVGYSEILLYDLDESNPLRPGLVNILSGSLRAAAIVQDLLTLARRGISNKQVVNLNKIIVDVQNSPEFENLSAYHSSIKVEADLEPDLLNISGSVVHLGKTLFNLVSNAGEAMPKGGTLTIKTSNQYLDRPVQGYDEVLEGDYVVLFVSDTGDGIPAADLKRIFEPFYSKKVMGRSGTGLGLAVVWGTVKDHNGYIDVQSEEGRGSTFTLYFPVTREEITPEEVTVSLSEYLGRGETILIIDDVKGQRDLATMMLKKLNYKVTSVQSGEEAVDYLRAHKVDLLVLDMIMDPGMDGLDTYRNVLKIHPRQKAIIVSGFSETERVNTAQVLGAGAYVKKPYVIEKLGLVVRKELDRVTGTREE